MQKYLLFLLIVCFTYKTVNAQSSTNQGNNTVHKEYQQTLFQLSGRVDAVIDKHNLTLYLESLYNTNGVYASIIEQTRWNIKPGFDWGISDKWHVGASERINSNNGGIYNYITRFYIQHRGKIGSTIILTEALYEQFNFVDGTLSNTSVNGTTLTRRPAEGRVSLGLGVGRFIGVKEHDIGIFLSYRPYLQFDYVQDGVAFYSNRFIDYTNLRLDAGFLFNKTCYTGFYACRDTNFSYVPASDPYNRNAITPSFGLVLNVLLFSNNMAEKTTDNFSYFYTKQ
ncbi:hypothetical protein [Cytophaga aurantiaca]|uniref:hypothetical protein n=1 Tax=Cytophaga aurantiaca TaxID=29530 RepID=UPI000377F579|nr:hypothetical protein [Cytophaga aurantiaca]